MSALDYTNRVIDEIFSPRGASGNSLLTPRLPPVEAPALPDFERIRLALSAPHWTDQDCLKVLTFFIEAYPSDLLWKVCVNWHDECEIGRIVKAMVKDSIESVEGT